MSGGERTGENVAPLRNNPFGALTVEHLDLIGDDTTRGRLIRATIELFIEGGYEATRVQRIARKAGLTTGAIYANFASKEALLSEAIGQASLAALRASVVEVGQDLTAADILALLGTEALAAPPRGNHAMIMQGLAGASRDGKLHDTVTEPIGELRDTIKALLIQARRDGDIDPKLDLDALSWLALTITMGSFTLKALNLTLGDDVAAHDVLRRMLQGFAPPADPAAEPGTNDVAAAGD